MKTILLLAAGLVSSLAAQAADTLFVKEPQIPVLIERKDNVLFYMRMDAQETQKLDHITLEFGPNVPLSQIQSVKLYYGGTDARQDREKERFFP